MSTLLALARLALMIVALSLGLIIILLLSLLPQRRDQVSLAARVTTVIARIMIWSFGIRLTCRDPARIRRHQGFLFANHTSYMDIVALQAIMPVRYVAKIEVKRVPIIGRIATAIRCVYVDRASRQSREAARTALHGVERFPAMVIFPEGKSGPGDRLLPFRYGGFEIAVATEAPILPCAISYDRPHITTWRARRFGEALWNLATRPGPIYIHVEPLDVIRPSADDDPVALSQHVHTIITDALRGTAMIAAETPA